MKTATYIILALMLVWSAAADTAIEGSSYADTVVIEQAEEFHTYTITPDESDLITIDLTGDTAYYLNLYFQDANEQNIFMHTVPPGESVTIEYTVGKNKLYYIVVETFLSQGNLFTLSYTSTPQNDANSKTDASKNFREGLFITPGTYEGFLGDEDVIDYYRLQLSAQEKITLTLTPEDKDSPRLTIIDGNLNTKINKRAQVEGEELSAVYTALRDEIISIGVEGTQPYSFTIESDQHMSSTPETITQTDNLPPPPANTPGEAITGTTTTDNDVPDESVAELPPTTAQSSFSWLWLLLIMLVLVAMAAYFLKPKMKAKEGQQAKPVTEEKPAPKDAKDQKPAPKK